MQVYIASTAIMLMMLCGVPYAQTRSPRAPNPIMLITITITITNMITSPHHSPPPPPPPPPMEPHHIYRPAHAPALRIVGYRTLALGQGEVQGSAAELVGKPKPRPPPQPPPAHNRPRPPPHRSYHLPDAVTTLALGASHRGPSLSSPRDQHPLPPLQPRPPQDEPLPALSRAVTASAGSLASTASSVSLTAHLQTRPIHVAHPPPALHPTPHSRSRRPAPPVPPRRRSPLPLMNALVVTPLQLKPRDAALHALARPAPAPVAYVNIYGNWEVAQRLPPQLSVLVQPSSRLKGRTSPAASPPTRPPPPWLDHTLAELSSATAAVREIMTALKRHDSDGHLPTRTLPRLARSLALVASASSASLTSTADPGEVAANAASRLALIGRNAEEAEAALSALDALVAAEPHKSLLHHNVAVIRNSIQRLTSAVIHRLDLDLEKGQEILLSSIDGKLERNPSTGQ